LAPTALEKEEEKAKSKVENPYDNLPIKSGKESADVIMVGNKENLEIDTKFESSQLEEDILAGNWRPYQENCNIKINFVKNLN